MWCDNSCLCNCDRGKSVVPPLTVWWSQLLHLASCPYKAMVFLRTRCDRGALGLHVQLLSFGHGPGRS